MVPRCNKAQVDTYNSQSPSAKGTRKVSETSNHIDSAVEYPLTPLILKEKKPETHGIPIKLKVIAGFSAVALLTAIGAGIYAETSGKTPAKAKAVATGEAHPSEHPTPESSITVVETATPVEQLIAAHEIKANQDPEALSKNFVFEISNWEMAGSETVVKDWTDQIGKTADASDGALSKFLDEYTAKQANIYGSALFGKDYASNLGVRKALNGFQSINKDDLQNVIASSQDKSPYAKSMVYVSPMVSSTETSLSFNFVEKDNQGQGNRVTEGVIGAAGMISLNYETLDNKVIIKTYTETS